MPPLVSIVIPVRNDAEPLARLLSQLHASCEVQIVVSVAGEGDSAVRALARERVDLEWTYGATGRAAQLNAGAAQATGDWLWFLHADSVVPDGWLDAFRQLEARYNRPPPTANQQSATGHRRPATEPVGGSFRFALDSAAWQARVIERGVAGRVRWLNLPYGDQGIFVRRQVFTSLKGFASLPILEDVELISRLKRFGRLRHLNLRLTTSARRWEREGWWRRSAGNTVILGLYWLGVSPERLARRYYRG